MNEIKQLLEPLGRVIKRRSQPEKRIQDQILTALRFRRLFAFHIPNHGLLSRRTGKYNKVGQFHVPGIPDVAVLLPAGRILWIEVKSADGRQSPDQVAVQKRLGELGHVYLLVRSLQDVLDWIRAHEDFISGADPIEKVRAIVQAAKKRIAAADPGGNTFPMGLPEIVEELVAAVGEKEIGR
jgi:hypothetical protein